MAKKKEKNTVVLPKAWQSVKHRNETAQAKANYEDTWKALGTIALVLVIIFVLLGGISMTGTLKFFFNWSHTIGEAVSNWFEGGSIVVNDDGVYYDPTGEKGTKIGQDNDIDPANISNEIDTIIEAEHNNGE